MKKNRQKRILELIVETPIGTQEEITARLIDEGYAATQATVSRDMRELHITKANVDGIYRYVKPQSISMPTLDETLKKCVLHVNVANNIMVVKTSPGLANAVALSIDKMETPQILGCVAGDDTIIVVLDSEESAREFSVKVKE